MYNVQDISEVFEEFSKLPIGSGSIAQVYKAKIRGGQGHGWVAVKVAKSPFAFPACLPGPLAPSLPGPLAPSLPGPLAPSLPGPLAPSLLGPLAPSLPGPLAPSLPGPLAPSLPGPLAPLLHVCLAASLDPFAEVFSLVSWIAGSAPWRGEAAVDRLCATQGPRGHARLHTRCAMDGSKGEPRAV